MTIAEKRSQEDIEKLVALRAAWLTGQISALAMREGFGKVDYGNLKSTGKEALADKITQAGCAAELVEESAVLGGDEPGIVRQYAMQAWDNYLANARGEHDRDPFLLLIDPDLS